MNFVSDKDTGHVIHSMDQSTVLLTGVVSALVRIMTSSLGYDVYIGLSRATAFTHLEVEER